MQTRTHAQVYVRIRTDTFIYSRTNEHTHTHTHTHTHRHCVKTENVVCITKYFFQRPSKEICFLERLCAGIAEFFQTQTLTNSFQDQRTGSRSVLNRTKCGLQLKCSHTNLVRNHFSLYKIEISLKTSEAAPRSAVHAHSKIFHPRASCCWKAGH